MIEDKGIAGFKKNEFATSEPERVFGSDVRLEDLPNGVRLYLREKKIDLETKKVLVNVYKLVDDGGLKNKKMWVGKVENRKPEEHEIAEWYGGGDFIWIMKWLSRENEERGIISEMITIDEEFGRAAHTEWLRKQKASVTDSTPAVHAPIASAPASSFGGDAAALLKLLDAADERSLARIERVAIILGANKAQAPSDVLNDAYKGANEMMQKAVEMNLQMAKSVNKVNQKSLEAPVLDDGDGDAEEGAGMDEPQLPAWLAPFMPHIKAGLGKLLEGGPTGSLVKQLIITSAEWKEIFADKDKWGQAVSAMEAEFGAERTKSALDILLNRRDEKKSGKSKK